MSADHTQGQVATESQSRTGGGRTPVLQGKGLVNTFGRVIGLDGVDLELYPGEVLAIIGDNGAGKSTLIKCLSGAYTIDAGELTLDGQRVNFKRPQDARDAGIETVKLALPATPDRTCQNWTSAASGTVGVQVGHHNKAGGGAMPTSWNAAHANMMGCSLANLRATGGAGRFYCFASD